MPNTDVWQEVGGEHVLVHRHQFGEYVLTFACFTARNTRRSATAAPVHVVDLARPGEGPGIAFGLQTGDPLPDRAICGAIRGEHIEYPMPAGMPGSTCTSCLYRVQRMVERQRERDERQAEREAARQARSHAPAGPDSGAPLSSAEAAALESAEASLKVWRAHIKLRPADGLAEVALNGASPVANALIKDIPGRQWHRDAARWLIPAGYAGELATVLAEAGIDVRIAEGTPEELAVVLRERWEPADIGRLAGLLAERP